MMRCDKTQGVFLPSNCRPAVCWAIGCCLAVWVSPSGWARADHKLAERRERLASMTPAEKEELRSKQQRFERMSPEEQERLRRLDRQLRDAPDSKRLQTVMRRYYEWLKTLSASQRAELLGLPIDQRVAKIKEIVRWQEAQNFRRLVATPLPEQDMKNIFDWLDQYIRDHESQLMAILPPNKRHSVEAIEDDRHRRRALLFSANHQQPPQRRVMPGAEDIANLKQQLSPTTCEALQKAGNTDEQVKLVRIWVRAAYFSRIMSVSEQELKRFYCHELSAEDHDKLENMSADQMHRELRRLYHVHRFQRMSREGPSHGGFHGHRGPDDHRHPGGRSPMLPGRRPPSPRGGRFPRDKKPDVESRDAGI